MSKLALIALALYFAERGAAAERAVDQVTASIKTKAAEVFARARAARPEKADDRRDVSLRRPGRSLRRRVGRDGRVLAARGGGAGGPDLRHERRLRGGRLVRLRRRARRAGAGAPRRRGGGRRGGHVLVGTSLPSLP